MTQAIQPTEEIWNVLGERIVCRVSGAETFGRFAVVEETSPPAGFVPPHFHHHTDELVYVLEGEYEVVTDGEKRRARPGEMLFIRRGTTHSLRNVSAAESRFLAIITPSGFENFFAEISRLDAPEIEKIVEIGKRNDLALVME
ncbi:MAG: cupin domain-containing protein [Acidobacteria bacterium]|nr:cupin domain-containing protein [Acidobacteriota bacterium]